jgi:hypothetical protein
MLTKVLGGLLLTAAFTCLAQESIESVMARMQPQGAVQIAYQETRYMGLLSEDWHGSGFLYAAAPNTLLKQQQQPDIEIMAAEGSQLIYSKPSTQTFHQLQIDESDPMMASLAAFKGIMTGNLPFLRQAYDLQFSASDSSWKLELTAKEHEPEEVALKIIMHGLPEQAANKMTVFLPDGDRSAYVLSKPEQGLFVKQKLVKLLQSLKGH